MYQEPLGVDLAAASPDRRARERRPFRQKRRPEERVRLLGAVSYTHLDVYKRQAQNGANFC